MKSWVTSNGLMLMTDDSGSVDPEGSSTNQRSNENSLFSTDKNAQIGHDINVSEPEKGARRIEAELRSLIADTVENELDEPFEVEAVHAQELAASKIAYRKKYYDVFKDEFIFFPSVAHTIMNYSLTDEAEKHYFDEVDEFPMEYTAALRSTAEVALR
jgi:hypothetical protein